MKQILFFQFIALIIIFLPNITSAQNIGINGDGSKPNANAMLDVKASDKGILIPRTSTTSRTAIPNTKGLLVYDTTINSFYYNDGSAWHQISNGNASLNGTANYIAKFTGSLRPVTHKFLIMDSMLVSEQKHCSKITSSHSSVVFSAAGDIPSASTHSTRFR